MATFSSDDIKKTAHLARLSFPEDALGPIEKKLSDIMSFAEQISAVNTDAVETLAHPLELHQRARKDKVTEPNQRDTLQAIAPQTEAGLYLVPQVIE